MPNSAKITEKKIRRIPISIVTTVREEDMFKRSTILPSGEGLFALRKPASGE